MKYKYGDHITYIHEYGECGATFIKYGTWFRKGKCKILTPYNRYGVVYETYVWIDLDDIVE